MPILLRVIAFLRRLHSVSCTYLPDDRPKPTSWTPPLIDCKHDSLPLDINDGLMAVLTGILLEPAPLYVLLTLPLLEFDVFKSPSILVPSSRRISLPSVGSSGGGSISGAGLMSCPKAGTVTLISSVSRLFVIFISYML